VRQVVGRVPCGRGSVRDGCRVNPSTVAGDWFAVERAQLRVRKPVEMSVAGRVVEHRVAACLGLDG